MIGMKMKMPTTAINKTDGPHDEFVAAHRATRGKAERKQEQECTGDQQRAPAHAELANIKLAENSREPLPLKPSQTDAKALQQKICQPYSADRNQETTEKRVSLVTTA